MTSLVLTVIGPDRPGLVEALSEAIADHGANWLESRMSRLEGRFAGLLHVNIPEANADDLTRALEELRAHGLRVTAQASEPALVAAETRPLRLELVGQDHPGIIRQLSHALAERQVNVDELETSVTSAPMSGEALFRARASLRVPGSIRLEELRETLEKIANELMIDLSLDDSD
ncbi:MAG TPA: ACT domain-containing protein [Myxococcota bacterium]